MQQIWARIETVLGRIAPRVLAAMPPGATEEEIEAVEAVMGVELPEDVRDSYRYHDGLPGVLIGWHAALYSLGEMVDDWRQRAVDAGDPPWDEREEDGVIRRDISWSAGWIPFIGISNGDVICIDLDPPTPERRGQVIDWSHEGWRARYETAGLREFLEDFATDLEADRYQVDETGGAWSDSGLPLVMLKD
ncbi:SMI1/KNR4 family protein (plasmid) [Streptomyces sp. NBC_00984]|uniref:SMI1/KNR4 family protein n=1 Tax=Streptomyces sp. NBC_00984 TaxID=2903700 RepID=UPI002F90676B|nr:SMI1/KNR4 family protein [Streptomyces sp. NBC_00984]